MKSFIKAQVQSCLVCQQSKPERVKYPGLLQPLSVPQGAWKLVSMDFIEGLPTSGHFNSIIVFVDTFTKYARFVPIRHPYTTDQIADVFIDNVYKLDSMPQGLVSDRGLDFYLPSWCYFLQ